MIEEISFLASSRNFALVVIMNSLLYKSRYFPYIVIIGAVLLTTILAWAPFLLHVQGINGIRSDLFRFDTILRHWDGLLYIIPAKVWYDVSSPLMQMAPLGLSPNYFAAHLPGFPFTIWLLAPLFGYLKGMLVATVLASCALFTLFYYFVKRFELTEYPLSLTLALLVVTPRFFAIRSVGSGEPLFMLCMLLSIFFFLRKRFLYAGLAGAVMIATRTPGALIAIGMGGSCLYSWYTEKKFNPKWLYLGLIPLGLLGVFGLYGMQMGNFWAYFNAGDNIHLVSPYAMFNFQNIWVQTGWLEEILFYLFMYVLSIFALVSSRNVVRKHLGIIMIPYVVALFFILHRDIARYSIPLVLFSAVAFEQFLTSKYVRIALLIIFPGVLFYTWNFMLTNIAPVGDWSPFL